MFQVTKNWVSSSAPLDSPVKTPDSDVCRVSAGIKLKRHLSF